MSARPRAGGELVPATSTAFIARHFGEAGRAWLERVPALLETYADHWRLVVGEELRGGLLSRVFAVQRVTGERAVLKLCGPWDRAEDEISCLARWNGEASPRLLASDRHAGALLLERIDPGGSATGACATDVAAVLQRLHTTPYATLRPLGEVARRRVERALAQGRTTPSKAEWALARIDELEHDPPAPVLLHGDFDERNLLACARRGLAAIDPLPCFGDAAYDAGSWAQANGRPGRRARTTAIADAMGLPVARVRGWCAVVVVHG
ncbi:MAG TPA: aminoglycoside phosphotransferase family protein [Gaiellaceae bacterium]|nr:aminoglycoside phosphotransferase family protein [Gaiellaceae bacterium]